METLRQLYATLDARWRPEDVADLILDLKGFTEKERGILREVAKWSYRRDWRTGKRVRGSSSMPADFSRPADMSRPLRVASELFAIPQLEAAANPMLIEAFVRQAGAQINKPFGQTDFLKDRLDRKARRAQGLGDLSKRQYNKRFRLASRMEKRLGRLQTAIQMREYQQVSKSGFAYRVSWEEFSQDPVGAAFVAYFTAASNRRSMFVAGPQRRAFDTIAEMLLTRAERKGANWGMIAKVYTDPKILAKLTDEARGQMLGEWYNTLIGISSMLEDVWNRSNINRRSMVVRKGNDSSTWNVLAGAWNKSRGHWVSLLHVMEMDAVLDQVCPGKVLRLMAADVAYWHQAKKGEDSLEPDTAVWLEVPLPWQVLKGEVSCTRAEVEAICGKHGVDPVKKGWTGAKARAKIVEDFVATPELVHGVSVGSPRLAAMLRKAKWFSGKRPSPEAMEGLEDVEVLRDEHGGVLHVREEVTANVEQQD